MAGLMSASLRALIYARVLWIALAFLLLWLLLGWLRKDDDDTDGEGGVPA